MPRKAKKQKTEDDEEDVEKLFREIETWDSKKVEEALKKLLEVIIIDRTGKDNSNLLKKLYLLVLKSPYSNWKKSSLTVRLSTPRNVILKTLRDYSNYVTLDYKDLVFEFKKIFENSPVLKEYSLIHAALCTSFLLVQAGKPEIVEVFPFVEKIAYECLKIVSEKQEEPISEQGGIIGELLRVCLDIFCSIWINDLYSGYFESKSAVIDICMKSLSLEITKWKPEEVRRRVEILSPSMIWLEVREEAVSTIHRIVSKDKEIDIELRRKLILLVMKVMKDTPILIDETEHFRRDSVSLMQDLVVESPEVLSEFQVKIIDECIIPVLEPVNGEIPENEINITKEFAIHFFKKLVGDEKVPEIGKQILSDPKSSVHRKYAALEFIKDLHDEELFQKYVVPLLDDEHSLLKIEACRILQYAKFTSTDVKPIFNTILQLMKDKDVEVQRQAFASTLSFLSSINPEPEFTSNFFKGNLETMLKLLFGTRDEELQLMLETLGVCMIQIGREVVPYLDKILDATMKLFRRNFDPKEMLTMNSKEMRQRERIVTEVLQFYSNIFESFKRFPDICESMYEVLEVNMFPLIIITEDEEDYLEEFFRLLVGISDCRILKSDMWRFLNEILSHYDVHADDFWGDIGALIINYVKYDVETFLEKNFVERAWRIVNEALSTMNVPQYQVYSLIMDSMFTQSYLFRESVNKKQKVMSTQQKKSMKYLESKVLPQYFQQVAAMIPEAPKPFPQKTLILGIYNCFFYSPTSCVALASDMSDEALDEIIQSLGTFIKVVTKRAEIFGLIGIISVMKQLPRNFQEKSAKIFPYLVTAMHNFEVKVKQITENESNSEDKPAFPIAPKVDPRDESYEYMDTDDSDEDEYMGEGAPSSHLMSDVVISLQHDFYPDIYTPNFKLMFGDTVQRDSSLREQMKTFLNAQEKEYMDHFIQAAQAIRVPPLLIKVIKYICEDIERFASELHRIPPEIIEEIQVYIATNRIKIPGHVSILKEKS